VLWVICIVPMLVALLSFLINGSDYFIGGMIGIITGPILYLIWRKMYGGLTKKDAEQFPSNPKTGLAMGDMKRMAILFAILAAIGLMGIFFLPWYESDWGSVDYYEGMFEQYDEAVFATTMACIKVVTVISAVVALVLAIIGNKIEPKKTK
jgi:hypothetical protein